MFKLNEELKQRIEVSSKGVVLTEVKVAWGYGYSIWSYLQSGALRYLNILMTFSRVQIPFCTGKKELINFQF